MQFSGMQRRVWTDALEERMTSIFKAENVPSKKPAR
jgi:hypothetical protein